MNKLFRLGLTVAVQASLITLLPNCQRQELPAPISPVSAGPHAANTVNLGDVIVIGRRPIETKTPDPGDGGSGGGDGGHGPGGSTGGGGGGGGGNHDAVEHLFPVVIGIPTIGDTQVILSKSWNDATTIKVVMEYTSSTHSVDKLTVVSTGLVAGTKFDQVGNGIASYNQATDSYSYRVTFQQVISVGATGDILAGPLFQVYGTYYSKTKSYSINFTQVP